MIGKILRLAILIGLAFGVKNYYHIGQSDASVPPASSQAAATAPSGQYYKVTQTDLDYMNNYMKSTDPRAVSFGSSSQTITLPSGTAVEFQLQKTQTGWCPQRNEPTFSFSMNTKKPLMAAQ